MTILVTEFVKPELYIFFHNEKVTAIHVIGTWSEGDRKELRGSAHMKDIQEGRFQFYPARRCQPYSPELWDACMRWMSKRDLLRAEYDELMRKGVKNGT